jgi:hypothetical protein
VINFIDEQTFDEKYMQEEMDRDIIKRTKELKVENE